MVAEVTKHKQNAQNIAIKNGVKPVFYFKLCGVKTKIVVNHNCC